MRVSTKTLSTRLAIVTTLFLATACTLHRANNEEGTAGIKDDDAAAGVKSDDEGEAKLPPKTEAKAQPAAPAAQVTTSKGVAAKTSAKSAVNAAAMTGKQPAAAKRSAKVEPKAKPAVRTAAVKTTATEDRMIRYVTAESLNVRTAPRADAPVVGRLTRGTMFAVTVAGEWAKLGEGQYVLAKFLSRSQPDHRLASK